ncbi:DUF6326 family protein [Chloroflexota bacterium]
MEDTKINVKIKLSAAWAAVMFLYVYGDFLGLYNPGFIEQLIAGEMLGMQITQVTLLGIAILMAFPSVMVFLSLTLKAKANRWANIILGIVYTAVMLVTGLMAIFDGLPFYVFLAILEVALTVLIVRYAWKWPKLEG